MGEGQTPDRSAKKDVRILDDSPLESQPYRIGAVFALYEDGVSVNFEATEIVERDGRRITYGVPTDKG